MRRERASHETASSGLFLRFAECVEPKINSKDRGIWLERLEVEHDNLRAALARSRDEEAEAKWVCAWPAPWPGSGSTADTGAKGYDGSG